MIKLRKKISVMLAGCLTLGMISSPMAIAETSAPEGYVKTNSGLYIKKSVSPMKDAEGKDIEGQYRLTFDVSGTAPTAAKPTAEIVLVIDRSGSMEGDKMKNVKAAAKEFCQTILEGKKSQNGDVLISANKDNAKISIVSYAADASLNIKSSNSLSSLNAQINNMNAYGGTNTESGINKAKEVLDSVTADKKYVVMFTDGLPTYNDSYKDKNAIDLDGNKYNVDVVKNAQNNIPDDMLVLGGYGSASYDNDIKGAQRAYYNIVGSSSDVAIGGIAPWGYYVRGGRSYRLIENKVSETETLLKKDISSTASSEIKFYSIGLFTSSTNLLQEVESDIITDISNEQQNIEANKNLDQTINDTMEEDTIIGADSNDDINLLTESDENKLDSDDLNNNSKLPNSKAMQPTNNAFSSMEKDTQSEATIAKNFLFSIQNIESNYSNYVNDYYTSKTSDMSKIFDSIATGITGELNAYLGKNVVIKDTVTSDFSIVDLAQNDIKGVEKSNVIISEDKKDITISLGDVEDINSDLSKPDKTISFVIKVNDPYLFGENIPTNTIATIDHTNPVTNIRHKNEPFNEPHVTIHPKKATIKVSKLVQNENNYIVDEDEVFPILITEDASTNGNKEQYNFLLKDGQSETITVYLRGENTNINTTYANAYKNNTNYNFDKTLNFLTVGNYTVSEVVPMNYKLLSITNKNFTVDKDHKNIEILVTNECINDSYFHDSEDKPNELIYKPQQNVGQ